MERFVIHPPEKALAHCVIGVNTGWRHEYPGVRGISHLIEHALLLGNKEHPAPDIETFRYGFNNDGRTLPEMVLFVCSCLGDDLPRAHDILRDLVVNPSFDPERVAHEKKINILPCTLVGKEETDPYPLALDWIKNLLFDWDVSLSLGTAADLEPLGVDELVAWHRQAFTPQNMFTCFSGAYREINNDPRGADQRQAVEPSKIQRSQWGTKEKILIDPTYVGVEAAFGYTFTDHTPAVDILQVLLGNNPLSKLWTDPFKRHAYTNFTDAVWTSTGGGFIIEFSLNDAGGFGLIREELHRLFDDFQVTQDELASAINMRSLHMAKQVEDGMRGLVSLLQKYPLATLKNVDGLVESYRTVTRDDILALVHATFTRENEYTVFVGPRG